MSGSSTPRTVGKDGEVILGPPTVFTIENIDQFDFVGNK
jgi:rhamnose transport system substrate-binding protein